MKKSSTSLDKNKYRSNIAETIEAGGNLLTNIGNVKNPAFLLIFLCIVGFLLIFGYQAYSFNTGLIRIGDKFDTLNSTVADQKAQNAEVIKQNGEQIQQNNELMKQNSEQIQQQNSILKTLDDLKFTKFFQERKER